MKPSRPEHSQTALHHMFVSLAQSLIMNIDFCSFCFYGILSQQLAKQIKPFLLTSTTKGFYTKSRGRGSNYL